jgi:hypothetical protein
LNQLNQFFCSPLANIYIAIYFYIPIIKFSDCKP